MKNLNQRASCYDPRDDSSTSAIQKTAFLGIGAHQDDLEFMCFDAILKGLNGDGFSALILSDGSGSARNHSHQNLSPQEFSQLRNEEQKNAAKLASYKQLIQLNHPSSVIKERNASLIAEISDIIQASSPQVIYTHNPFDKHLSHVATLECVVSAILELAPQDRPKKLIGCEVWRSLDWLPQKRKLIFEIDAEAQIRDQLLECFPSQSGESKNYSKAVQGRRICNATFLDSYNKDQFLQVEYAIDLSEVISQKPVSLHNFSNRVLEEFKTEIFLNLGQPKTDKNKG